MPHDSYSLRFKGLVHLPGVTPTTRKVAEDILRLDVDEHHCYYRVPTMHNHLSHHLLAAYDLGATPALLKQIEKRREKKQRPIQLNPTDKDIVISDENWIEYVGNSNAYYGYYVFFSSVIDKLGYTQALEKYIFSEHANSGKAKMLLRTMSGALHPLIHMGYGIEFGHDRQVAAGLAMAAVTTEFPDLLFNFENTYVQGDAPSLLELLKELYDNDGLEPVRPYSRDYTVYDHILNFMKSDKPPKAAELIAKYFVDSSAGDEQFDTKVEECFWVSVLLSFATGKEGRKPRIDFGLMHLVTSALFFPTIFRILPNPVHKAQLLRGYFANIVFISMIRGRPVIKPNLLMSYTDVPRPPINVATPPPHPSHLGDESKDEFYNPWPVIISANLGYPDSHHPKVVRSLVYAAQHYGDVAAGKAVGAFLRGSTTESHPGTASMDGTIFVRAAAVLMEYMHWTGYGEAPIEGDWDQSGLGWDEAWDDGA